MVKYILEMFAVFPSRRITICISRLSYNKENISILLTQSLPNFTKKPLVIPHITSISRNHVGSKISSLKSLILLDFSYDIRKKNENIMCVCLCVCLNYLQCWEQIDIFQQSLILAIIFPILLLPWVKKWDYLKESMALIGSAFLFLTVALIFWT